MWPEHIDFAAEIWFTTLWRGVIPKSFVVNSIPPSGFGGVGPNGLDQTSE